MIFTVVSMSGVPHAEAEKLLESGMTTRVEIMRTGESSGGAKRWRAIFTVGEHPHMNDVIDYEEGKESVVEDPAFGGTMRILTTEVNESTLKFDIDHSKGGAHQPSKSSTFYRVSHLVANLGWVEFP